METRKALLITTMLIALAVPALGQHEHSAQKTDEGKSHTTTAMMGTPAFDRSVDGLRIQVWVITQEAHKKMMDEKMKGDMKGGMMGMMHGTGDKGEMHSMDHDSMDEMMSGTHHIMVSLTDEKTKAEIDKAKIEVRITTPSKNDLTTKLSAMKGHFGGGATLNEKGEYTVNVIIEEGGKSSTQEFRYKVE